VAEGDDEPAKCPGIFAGSKVLLLNKISLPAGGHVEFDTERAKADAAAGINLSKFSQYQPRPAKVWLTGITDLVSPCGQTPHNRKTHTISLAIGRDRVGEYSLKRSDGAF